MLECALISPRPFRYSARHQSRTINRHSAGSRNLWLLQIDRSGLTCPSSTWHSNQKDGESIRESMVWTDKLDCWPTDNASCSHSSLLDCGGFTQTLPTRVKALSSLLTTAKVLCLTNIFFFCPCLFVCFTCDLEWCQRTLFKTLLGSLSVKMYLFPKPWTSTLGKFIQSFSLCRLLYTINYFLSMLSVLGYTVNTIVLLSFQNTQKSSITLEIRTRSPIDIHFCCQSSWWCCS